MQTYVKQGRQRAGKTARDENRLDAHKYIQIQIQIFIRIWIQIVLNVLDISYLSSSYLFAIVNVNSHVLKKYFKYSQV